MIEREDIEKIFNEYNDDKNMHIKRGNGLVLSDNQIEILKKYGIDYKIYSSLNALLYDIEEILNDGEDATDLDILSQELSEFNYYNNTNK